MSPGLTPPRVIAHPRRRRNSPLATPARRTGASVPSRTPDLTSLALPAVATALPPAATLDVAVYVLHMLRSGAQGDPARPLVDNAEQNAAAALHRCHRALELG